ncbi:hypothetical protein ACTMU2_10600 [Cupriavidus basilensis]
MKVSADIGALVERRKQGYSPRGAFLSERGDIRARYGSDFRKHWIQVAVEPDVPEPGDYVTVELGSDFDPGRARRRYAGARFPQRMPPSRRTSVQRGQGHGRQHRLPVSQLDLQPERRPDVRRAHGRKFDRCKHSLKSVHVQNLAGLIFVCLADEALADFAAMRAAMEPYLLPHDLPNTKIAAGRHHREGELEAYDGEQPRGAITAWRDHPELTISLYEYGFGYRQSRRPMPRAWKRSRKPALHARRSGKR